MACIHALSDIYDIYIIQFWHLELNRSWDLCNPLKVEVFIKRKRFLGICKDLNQRPWYLWYLLLPRRKASHLGIEWGGVQSYPLKIEIIIKRKEFVWFVFQAGIVDNNKSCDVKIFYQKISKIAFQSIFIRF